MSSWRKKVHKTDIPSAMNVQLWKKEGKQNEEHDDKKERVSMGSTL